MSKILRVALPIAFIVVFYAGEPAGTLFGCRAFNVIPPLMWLLLLVTLGAANAAIAFGLVRTERTRDLALWGLVLKVCFLPIFLVSLVVFALIGSQFSLRPEALPLEFALLTPYAVLSYALMIVTSCYGFAAIIRARDEQVISPETAKKYKRWHAHSHRRPGRLDQALSAPTPIGPRRRRQRAGRQPVLTRIQRCSTSFPHRQFCR